MAPSALPGLIDKNTIGLSGGNFAVRVQWCAAAAKRRVLGKPAPPRVLISYSQESSAHKERVLGLADKLCAHGVDANIDQYVHPSGG